MWPRPVQAVVFDMDGLLVDTERVLYEVMCEVGPDFGVAMDLELFKLLIGLPIAGSTARLKERYGEDFPMQDFLQAVGRKGRAVNEAGVVLKEGVIELLDDLDRHGLPRAVCTSSSHETVQRNLGGHGLIERFHTIVARGDYEKGKPHPEPFLTAAARLGVDPAACLALEDSHNGVRSACAAGMMTIMVPDMLDVTEEMQGLALRVEDTLHDVRRLLGP
jgi:HAD superfamily hydrolase (TIGR01509 family)